VVVHLAAGAPDASSEAQVGFVVGRAVGGAVVRNRVRRRLRHLVRERLAQLAPGSVLVVRALPAAAVASYDELGADLGRCLGRVLTAEPTAGTREAELSSTP
jgi:ribonuclease P protein component